MTPDEFNLDGVTAAESDATLLLLNDLSGFCTFASKLAAECRFTLCIYSTTLNPELYATEVFVDACSAFARRSRRSEIKILLRDSQPVVENFHNLVGLQKRLSDKIKLRVLPKDFDPENIQKLDRSFMVGDDDKILIKLDDTEWRGFVNLNDRPAAKEHGHRFNYLWGYGEPIIELQRLSL